jgi:hypothetical protein
MTSDSSSFSIQIWMRRSNFRPGWKEVGQGRVVVAVLVTDLDGVWERVREEVGEGVALLVAVLVVLTGAFPRSVPVVADTVREAVVVSTGTANFCPVGVSRLRIRYVRPTTNRDFRKRRVHVLFPFREPPSRPGPAAPLALLTKLISHIGLETERCSCKVRIPVAGSKDRLFIWSG